MRRSALFALLALAACSPDTPENTAGQPNESVVEGQMANAQIAVEDQIANDSAAAAANAGDDNDPVSFICENGKAVRQSFAGDDDGVRLTIDGRTFTLEPVPAASGARFHSAEGLASGKSLDWWTKGSDEAMLLERPSGSAPGSEGETVSACQAVD